MEFCGGGKFAVVVLLVERPGGEGEGEVRLRARAWLASVRSSRLPGLQLSWMTLRILAVVVPAIGATETENARRGVGRAGKMAAGMGGFASGSRLEVRDERVSRVVPLLLDLHVLDVLQKRPLVDVSVQRD